jgi:hypothetical protein
MLEQANENLSPRRKQLIADDLAEYFFNYFLKRLGNFNNPNNKTNNQAATLTSGSSGDFPERFKVAT